MRSQVVLSLCGLLGAMCLLIGAYTVWNSITEMQRVVTSSPAAPPVAATWPQSANPTYRTVAFAGGIETLFGRPMAEPPEVVDPETLPVTELDLALSGTFVSQRAGQSSALIYEEEQSGKQYFVGDTLDNGAIVRTITSGAVILEYQGELQTLFLAHHD